MPESHEVHRAQLEALLTAWGMPASFANRTVEVMSWADLHGIDSDGISMLPTYFERHKNGRVKMSAQPRIEQETPISALINRDSDLRHGPSRQAMEIAIVKARGIGIGVVSVHSSSHFGACGLYAKMAADADMVATSASAIQVAPAGGAQARLGTDPWAFAAPGRESESFALDMATTTGAVGGIRHKANENQPTPPGWLLTREGLPSIDPLEAVQKGGFLTSLDGSPEGSSYKGYGLSMMVNILGSCLSGTMLITDPRHTKKRKGIDIGRFFLAFRPTLFRENRAFEADVATLCDTLRATRPVDPTKPVMVTGDPGRNNAVRRMKDGIPVGPNLLSKIKEIAAESGVPWLVEEAA